MSTNQPDPKQNPTTTEDPDTEAHCAKFGSPAEQPEAEAHSGEARSEEEPETEAHGMPRSGGGPL